MLGCVAISEDAGAIKAFAWSYGTVDCSIAGTSLVVGPEVCGNRSTAEISLYIGLTAVAIEVDGGTRVTAWGDASRGRTKSFSHYPAYFISDSSYHMNSAVLKIMPLPPGDAACESAYCAECRGAAGATITLAITGVVTALPQVSKITSCPGSWANCTLF